MEDKIDYSQYSYADLLSARAGIDTQVYPDRARELDSLIRDHADNQAKHSHPTQVKISKSVPVLFHGKTGEYYAIWIVNLLLTILTLGIYSAWATVRNHRYFYSNTEIDGHRLSYLAQPMQILIGRVIGLALFGAYFLAAAFSPLIAGIIALLLFFATPIFICMSLRFRMRVTAYRNIKFNFTGHYGEAFLVFVILPIFSVFTLYLALPWVLKKIDEFIYAHISYGDRKMNVALTTSEYYVAALGAFFMGVALIFLAVMGLGVSMTGLSTEAGDPRFSWSFILFMLAYVAVILCCSSFYAARIRNHIFNSMQLEGVAQFESELTFRALVWLRLSNFIALIGTLGFALPWIKIRTAQLYSSVTSVKILEGADSVLGSSSQSVSAVGDEVANIFDIDVALG